MKRSVPPTTSSDHLDFSHVIPQAGAGLGVYQNTYSGGRTAVSVNHFGGLGQIIYWGRSPERAPVLFFSGNAASAYQRCFRAQIVIDGAPYNLEFSRTSHFPFGYRSHFSVPELAVELCHRLTLLNDALVFSIEVLRNDRQLPLRQRFEHHDHSFHSASGRTLQDWTPNEAQTAWHLRVRDEVSDADWRKLVEHQKPETMAREGRKLSTPWLDLGLRKSDTFIALFSSSALQMRTTHSHRRYFTGRPFRRGAQATVLLFANEEAALRQRMHKLERQPTAEAFARESTLLQDFRIRPVVRSGDTAFDSMFANIPAVLSSLMVQDIPGAFRASSLHYWVWGWDTFMCSEAYLLSGQHEFLKQALRFFRDTAHPELGVAHQLTRSLRAKQAMSPASQLLYTIVLYQYGVHTGDGKLWSELYPFVKRIFALNLPAILERGLREGRALFPDFPQFAGHTGQDISVFNNSLLYQGTRCLEEIAIFNADSELADEARRVSRRLEQNFVPAFWDRKRKYFVDSVDSRTYEQRGSYPAHALLWQTPFLSDLTGEKLADCGHFIAAHHQAKRGFLMYPRWDQAFDGDGNQFGQSWSTHDVFTTRAQAVANLQEGLDLWIANCSWFWRQLTLIEGYSAQTVNDSGTPDLPGGKQGFCRSIYMAFLTNIAGLHFDIGGVTIAEGASRPVSIERLPFRTAHLTVKTKGAGTFLKSLRVNGTPIKGSSKIPGGLLRNKVVIEVVRTTTPPRHPVILSLYGAELADLEVRSSSLKVTVSGRSHTWLHFYSPSRPSLSWQGRAQTFSYDGKTGQGQVLLPLSSGQPSALEISISRK